jgi:hypothetical protein
MFRTYMDEDGNVIYAPPNVVGNSPPIGVVGQVLPQSGPLNNNTNQYTLNPIATSLGELANYHATLLVGNSLIASGTGDDKAKQDPTYVVQRPWIEPPEGSVPFDAETSIALPAVGAGFTTIVSLVVPDGYDGAIKWYSWNFTGGGFVNGDGSLVVQLLRDGVPVRNYDNITVQKGTIEAPREISPLRVYSKQVISLVINHVSNGLLAGNVVGSLVGWFYPSMS